MEHIYSGKFPDHPWGHYRISYKDSICIDESPEIHIGEGIYFFHYIDDEIDHFCFYDSKNRGWSGFEKIKEEVHSDYCPLCKGLEAIGAI